MTTSFRNLRPLLNPKNIAIVGASEKHGSAGRIAIENLHYLGYQGEIFAINPKNGHKSLIKFNKCLILFIIIPIVLVYYWFSSKLN